MDFHPFSFSPAASFPFNPPQHIPYLYAWKGLAAARNYAGKEHAASHGEKKRHTMPSERLSSEGRLICVQQKLWRTAFNHLSIFFGRPECSENTQGAFFASPGFPQEKDGMAVKKIICICEK